MNFKINKYLKVLVISSLLLSVALFFYMKSIKNEHAKIYEEVASVYPEYSIQDLVKHSDIIASGEIIEISGPLEIEPVDGGDSSLFTDYIVKLNDIIKNESIFEDTVNLRIRGGESEDLIVVETDAPKITKNSEYLFFLSIPSTGGGYTTEDDHVLLTGGDQGLLDTTTVQEVFNNEAYNTVSKKEITTMVHDPELKKTKEETDPLYGLKENLKSGFITQEEYDETVKSLSKYAKIINKK